jgi:predicted MFS family arabinose efflux permease
VPDGRAAFIWAALLAGLPAAIALGLYSGLSAHWVLLGGLLLFGALFAVNSSLHSYLIVSYAKEDGVSLDVGFYYMSNAMGRLLGTLLSGWVYQAYGLEACLWISSAFVLLAALISLGLPRHAQTSPVG